MNPSPNMEHWNKDQVRHWALSLEGVDNKAADILFEQDVTGPSLMLLETKDLREMGVMFGPAKIIIHTRDECIKLKKEIHKPGRPCKPYPFYRCHDSCRYIEGDVINLTESGASDFIEPCHEYKAFINTTEETKMTKFTREVIRFAAACMNSRTNGTIHFGIGDEPHGQVLGVVVGKDKEKFNTTLRTAVDQYFEFKHKETAQTCIKPPRFVEVLNKSVTPSEKFVIEVDIVPDSTICRDIYHTYDFDNKKNQQFFVREGGSSRNLLAPTTSDKQMRGYEKFVANVMPNLHELRKQSEEKHLNEVKSRFQGSRLCQMITGGRSSLDTSYYEHYIIVTNKSHPTQLDSVRFLFELNPIAVLDFDPQSLENGLCECFEKQSPVTPHLPDDYKITDSVLNIAERLQLTRSTSWVFCNGGAGAEQPSEINHWLMDKGASVRNVISFLCRRDVLRNKRFLVVFLLLSRVNDKMDPLVETFCTFYQELRGKEQILCICDNQNTFNSWKDLIDARYEVNISDRCIYELNFSEVNGTILSLLSENRKCSRFLPAPGGGRVHLPKKLERQLTSLDVLCVNQCEGGHEDKDTIEQDFYRGGTVSWWNFYFSQQPGSVPFIKRDMFAYLVETLIPNLCSLRKACVLCNLLHTAGCGGTTLAKHSLWALKEKYRCAVLVDNSADPAVVAEHVVSLLKCGYEEQDPPLPVLLMIDDFEEMEEVFSLQQLIEKQCLKMNVQSRSPQVILLNCMQSEHTSGPCAPTEDTVFIGNKLSEKEQKQFDQKLSEIETNYKSNNTELDLDTFYGFMLMKKNFNEQYIESVVNKTLRSFAKDQKHAQLIGVLVLLSVYCRSAALSVSLCEDYLGLQPKPYCGNTEIEEGFDKFSTLVMSCDIRAKVLFKGVRMIHSRVAWHCLKELNHKHLWSKAEIANFLLTTAELYESTQGRDKLMQDVRYILVKRYSLEQEYQTQTGAPVGSSVQASAQGCSKERKPESRFSPLIRDIEKETPGFEENVLINASERFQKDAIIAQLLARYYYLKKKDFTEATRWAKKSKQYFPNNSYISDTAAQVIKHELKYAITNEQVPIEPKALHRLLTLAKSAVDAFKETQKLAKHESVQRLQVKRDNSQLNISGFLGEVQVCVHVIEVLQKIPVFSAGCVRHDILSTLLSGRTKLDDMKKNDPDFKHAQYYSVLQEFSEMLYSIKSIIKSNFDFLDAFNVNLSSKFGMKDSFNQIVQSELLRCFGKFAEIFCMTQSETLLLSKNIMNRTLELHKARQFIEKNKVDTYSGILMCLSDDTKLDILGATANEYKCICSSHSCEFVDRINYIYLNVVLSCIKPELIVEPYERLLDLLCKCLQDPTPKASLPLYYMAVLLLWPQKHLNRAESAQLRSYISHMKTAYHTEMKEVYNGKRAMVHFFLGKKHGYDRTVHLELIKRCFVAGEKQFASMWQNGAIWKNPEVKELLFRVTGQVKSRSILANTCIPDLNIEVMPQFPSQLRGYREGSTVSFFIGFSMQGPLAIDIDFD